jgi:hypothetical protein
MKRSAVFTTALLAMTTMIGAVAVEAQSPCVTPTKHKHSKKVEPCASAEKQLADLQAQLKAQQAQIDALSAQLSAAKPAAETDPIATPIQFDCRPEDDGCRRADHDPRHPEEDHGSGVADGDSL